MSYYLRRHLNRRLIVHDEIRVCDAEAFGIDFASAEYSYEVFEMDLVEIVMVGVGESHG